MQSYKIIVFGAAGSVGRQIVAQGLAHGHKVTAFTRNPTSIEIAHECLTVAKGDVFNVDEVTRSIEGHDVVFCALGGGLTSKARSEGTQTILRAMKRAGVNRFVVQTTLGAGDSHSNLNFYWKYLMFGMLLRPMFKDHQLQESYIKASDLDWTIVRPGAFTDGEKTGRYRHGFATTDRTVTLKISRADVADFMLKVFEQEMYVRETPGLSY